MTTARYRTIWVSDTHLGTRGCQAPALLGFLDGIECDYLYLVGDIIDFWRLKRTGHHLEPPCHDRKPRDRHSRRGRPRD